MYLAHTYLTLEVNRTGCDQACKCAVLLSSHPTSSRVSNVLGHYAHQTIIFWCNVHPDYVRPRSVLAL